MITYHIGFVYLHSHPERVAARPSPLPFPFRTGSKMSVWNGEPHQSPITLHLSAPALKVRNGEGIRPVMKGLGKGRCDAIAA